MKLTFIAGMLWVTGWWTVGAIPDSSVLPPLPRPISPAKAGATKWMIRCDVTTR
jgi:hypothetical protein